MDELTTKPGIWRCSICTYENHEISSSCDICGVVRDLNGIIGNDSGREGILVSLIIVASVAKTTIFFFYPFYDSGLQVQYTIF